jgi:hypothetical protein
MLDPRLSRFARTLVLAAMTLGTLQAQETGFYKDLKLRMGYGLQTKDNLRASSLGFGLAIGYATPSAKWVAELGYYYKTGDQYITGPMGTLPEGLTGLDPDRFGDSRRNSLDGLALRLSYQRKLSAEWDWQAGVMLGGTRFKHEYVGQAQSLGWASGAGDPGSWLDTWNGTPTKGGISISPFAGVTWQMGAVSSLEFNIMLLSYKALDYTHYVGTGTYALSTIPGSDENAGRISPNNGFPGDVLGSKQRMVPHLEVGYVFHF